MSNLCTIIEFIQNLCLEDVEINNMLKQIDDFNRGSTKLENQLEEFDREHLHLQIELYNLEMITSNVDISAFEHFHQTSLKMYKDSVELHNRIEKIDFTKILQCYHMEMEEKCRKEWQAIQDCFVRTLQWHEKMEQRYVVQKFRQTEIIYRKAEEANKNHQESMEKSFTQSLTLVEQSKEKRNELILILIKGCKDLNALKAKIKILNEYEVYINGLRQEKTKIQNQLELTHLKAFKPMLHLSTNQKQATTIKPNTEISNFIMPTLPSFTDILESFNQNDKITNITTIENTTNFFVKSILHTSSCKQSITTKQTKNVRFKVQLEEYQEEMTENVYSKIESESDEAVPIQATMEINKNQEERINPQEIEGTGNDSEIEIVDLLTPANDLVEIAKDNQGAMDSSENNSKIENQSERKSPIEIQDCIIFKTPFPMEDVSNIQNKQTFSNVTTIHPSTDTSLHSDIKDILNTTKKSFYEEFLNVSSTEASPVQSNNTPSVLKDFKTFFNGNKDFSFASKESNEDIESNKTLNNLETNKTTTSEAQDFLDFGSNKGFTFDSDDNMIDTYNAENMDFM